MGEEKEVVSSGSEEETTPPPTHSARTCIQVVQCSQQQSDGAPCNLGNGAALNQSREQKSFSFISKLDSLIYRNAQLMGSGGQAWPVATVGFAIRVFILKGRGSWMQPVSGVPSSRGLMETS